MKMNVGLDEVGRGPLAGPVVAGAVAFSLDIRSKIKILKNSDHVRFLVKGDDILITDSKKMTERQREYANTWIYQNALSFGIGKGSVNKINSAGIVKAANFAFRSAFNLCNLGDPQNINEVFIDAFYVPKLGKIKKDKQSPVVHGDAFVFEISAASIIAKVYRDNLMKKLSKNFPLYNWNNNKGYGTKDHIDAIKKNGTTKHHRTLYIRKYV